MSRAWQAATFHRWSSGSQLWCGIKPTDWSWKNVHAFLSFKVAATCTGTWCGHTVIPQESSLPFHVYHCGAGGSIHGFDQLINIQKANSLPPRTHAWFRCMSDSGMKLYFHIMHPFPKTSSVLEECSTLSKIEIISYLHLLFSPPPKFSSCIPSVMGYTKFHPRWLPLWAGDQLFAGFW